MTPRTWSLAIGLTLGIAGLWATPPVDGHSSSGASRIPRLMHTCLITDNVDQLVQFYEPILGLKDRGPVKITPSSAQVWGCLPYSRWRPRKDIFPARLRREGTRAHPGIRGCRRRCRICSVAEPGENMGQAAHHAALENSIHLLS